MIERRRKDKERSWRRTSVVVATFFAITSTSLHAGVAMEVAVDRGFISDLGLEPPEARILISTAASRSTLLTDVDRCRAAFVGRVGATHADTPPGIDAVVEGDLPFKSASAAADEPKAGILAPRCLKYPPTFRPLGVDSFDPSIAAHIAERGSRMNTASTRQALDLEDHGIDDLSADNDHRVSRSVQRRSTPTIVGRHFERLSARRRDTQSLDWTHIPHTSPSSIRRSDVGFESTAEDDTVIARSSDEFIGFFGSMIGFSVGLESTTVAVAAATAVEPAQGISRPGLLRRNRSTSSRRHSGNFVMLRPRDVTALSPANIETHADASTDQPTPKRFDFRRLEPEYRAARSVGEHSQRTSLSLWPSSGNRGFACIVPPKNDNLGGCIIDIVSAVWHITEVRLMIEGLDARPATRSVVALFHAVASARN